MWQKYIAFGDSVTAGVGDPVDRVEMQSWTDWVAESLRVVNPALIYLNKGQAGSTASHVLREQLPEVRAAKPDLVSITVGANDVRSSKWQVESFSRDLVEILQPFSGLGTTIIMMTYPDLRPAIVKSGTEIPMSLILHFQRLEAVNAAIREVSQRFNACLLDFERFAPAQNPAHISSDLVHPNALGHKYTANAALDILAERFDLALL